MTSSEGAQVGARVTHRRYVPYSHAHYAGSLVDGAYGLGLFGDVATDLCIATDGDEGLFASYDDVQFLAPVRAGDVVEVSAELVRAGNRSRGIAFTLRPGPSTPRSWPRPRPARSSSRPVSAADPSRTGVSSTTRRAIRKIHRDFCERTVNDRCRLTCEDARLRRSRDG
jgi:3-aminobutyryl-CoA ammonia-lyase